MKLKNKALIAGMAICLVGATGAAFAAATGYGAANQNNTASFDSAIYLAWGENGAGATISNVDQLSIGVAQYRSLTVAPKSTKTVAGTVTLTFTMAASANSTVSGMSIKVVKTDAAVAADDLDDVDYTTPDVTLTDTVLTGTTTFAVTAGEAAHTTTAYYAIEIKWAGASQAEGSKPLSGNITIAQSFAA